MGHVITFFSYKGGVGRTMALANSAVLLARWGYKTLVIDWDLEAPGLEDFFKNFIGFNKIQKQWGLIDLLHYFLNKKTTPAKIEKWKNTITSLQPPGSNYSFDIISSGNRNKTYFRKVRDFDIQTFYLKNKGGHYIEALRNDLKQEYDFILIDSRTGVTDIGGICTIQLPDILVLLFTANKQSLKGIVDVAKKANRARQNLPYDRISITSVPIASRFDNQTEFEISKKWISRFSSELVDLYADWLPIPADIRDKKEVKRIMFKHRCDMLEITKLPYVSYFSFGEKLPILEQGATDPAGLGYAYETLAALLANNLESVDELFGNRDAFVKKARKKIVKYDAKGAETISPNVSYVPRFKYDIYISFAHLDNLDGWVNRFHEHLNIWLARRFGKMGMIKTWKDSFLDPGRLFDQTIQSRINESALFLTVTSNAYLESEYCHKELEWFYDKAQQDALGGLMIGEHFRIINVLITNISYEKWPEKYGHTSGFPFHDAKSKNMIGYPMDTRDKAFSVQLRKLVDSISEILKIARKSKIENMKSTDVIASYPIKKTFSVFIAGVSDSLAAVRERIVAELRSSGVFTIADVPPPYDASSHDRILQEIARNSKLWIHLLDHLPGRKIDGKYDITYPQKQLELGMAFAESQIIWAPKTLDFDEVKDINQRTLLKRFENSKFNQTNYDFLRVSVTDLILEIMEKIDQIKHFPTPNSSIISPAVLLDTHSIDHLHAIQLSNYLSENRITSYINPLEDNPRHNIKEFEKRLNQVNSLVIIYGRVSKEWVLERLNTAIQMIIAYNCPITSLCIYLAPPRKNLDDIQLNQKFVKIHLLDNSGKSKLDPKIIVPIVESLSRRGAS